MASCSYGLKLLPENLWQALKARLPDPPPTCMCQPCTALATGCNRPKYTQITCVTRVIIFFYLFLLLLLTSMSALLAAAFWLTTPFSGPPAEPQEQDQGSCPKRRGPESLLMEGSKEQDFPSHPILLLGLLYILQQLSHLPAQLLCAMLHEHVWPQLAHHPTAVSFGQCPAQLG